MLRFFVFLARHMMVLPCTSERTNRQSNSSFIQLKQVITLSLNWPFCAPLLMLMLICRSNWSFHCKACPPCQEQQSALQQA